jgi:Spy/CpxP family protein refolding chaperone
MKKTLSALAILTLAVVAVAFGVARWSVRRAIATEQPSISLNDTGWLKRELKLTDDQTAKVENLDKEFRTRIEDCCAKHCSARFALREELAKSQVDLANTAKCVDRMAAAQSESERVTLDHILRVRAVLTPEQQKRYAALVSQQVCTACPMGMHKPS